MSQNGAMKSAQLRLSLGEPAGPPDEESKVRPQLCRDPSSRVDLCAEVPLEPSGLDRATSEDALLAALNERCGGRIFRLRLQNNRSTIISSAVDPRDSRSLHVGIHRCFLQAPEATEKEAADPQQGALYVRYRGILQGLLRQRAEPRTSQDTRPAPGKARAEAP